MSPLLRTTAIIAGWVIKPNFSYYISIDIQFEIEFHYKFWKLAPVYLVHAMYHVVDQSGRAVQRSPITSGQVAIERAIVFSRVVLAVGGLVATYLDPEQPSGGSDLGYAVLAMYVTFSLALVFTYKYRLGARWNTIIHCVEVAIVSLIILATEGPSSPFFVYFTFVLLVAALRWRWPGTIATGGFLSLILITLTASQLLIHFDKADVDRLIIRNVYLLVVTGLFAFLGTQFRRQSQQLERLALSQNIHDGILQTLTAVRLRLKGISENLDSGLRDQTLETAQLLNLEQRRLRAFVSETRDNESRPMNVKQAFPLSELTAEADRLQRLWGCQIDVSLDPRDQIVSTKIGEVLKSILAEGVANGVAHGGAKNLSICVARKGTTLHVQIKDNGRGLLESEKTCDLKQLKDAKIGPRSICQNVELLNGQMQVSTSQHGVVLDIVLPLDIAT